MSPLEIVFRKKLLPQFQGILENIFSDEFYRDGNFYFGPSGEIPFISGVPRFTSVDSYAKSFSYQWSIFSNTQLDSASNSDLTFRDLTSKIAISPDDFREKLVLDIGVGIGRHAEYFCKSGAYVIGVDLSSSVEKAAHNLRKYPNFVAVQCDLFNLPFRKLSFDLAYSIGVLHHTPNWIRALEAVSTQVKVGGVLAAWLYGQQFSRRDEWIPFTSQFELHRFLNFCELLCTVGRDNSAESNGSFLLPSLIARHFPFSVHHETLERSILALFDGYSPRYHAVTTSDEVCKQLAVLGFASETGSIEASAKGIRKQIT